MANVKTWNFKTEHVDPTALVTDDGRGNFVSSESIVLCAGPATMGAALADVLEDVVPIGVCDTIQVLQNKNVIQLYEIGSRIPYMFPGRPVTQFQISRVMFNGDSLLASLMNGTEEIADEDQVTREGIIGAPGSNFTIGGNGDTSGKFYLNLASSFFNNPFGLAMFMKDSEDQWVAGFYAENCIIQQHSMAIQGQNMIVMETASVRCTTFVPVPGGPAAG